MHSKRPQRGLFFVYKKVVLEQFEDNEVIILMATRYFMTDLDHTRCLFVGF